MPINKTSNVVASQKNNKKGKIWKESDIGSDNMRSAQGSTNCPITNLIRIKQDRHSHL